MTAYTTSAPFSLPQDEERPSVLANLGAMVDPRGVWWSFLLFSAMFMAVIGTIEGAKWVKEMPELSGFAIVALMVALAFSRLKVNQALIHPLAVVIGLLMSGSLIVSEAVGNSAAEKLADAIARMITFANVIASNGINIDGLPFAAQIVVLTWFVAYVSAWFYYRHHNMWLGVLPAGIGMAVNLTYVQGNYGANLAVYLFCALLLMMEMNRLDLYRRWRQAHVAETELKYSGSWTPVVLFAGAALSIAFLLPTIGQSVAVALAWEEATSPWRAVERQFDRLFASVSSGTVAPLHSFGRALPFKGAVNFGDQNPLAARLGVARDVVMYVKADESGYWRAETYSEYSSGGWLSASRVIRGVARDSLPGALEEYRERRPVQQTIELVQPIGVIPFRGLPLYVNQPANGETAPPAKYVLDLSDTRNNGGLPPELQRAANDISNRLRSSPQLLSPAELQRLLPPDVRGERPTRSGGLPVALEVTRTEPFPPDYSSIRPVSNAQSRQGFTIVSAVSKATVDMLRQAPTDLPGWVRDQYLQLPPTLPDRVRALAREWAQGATNNFDRALAIESRLRDYPYTTNIPAPPRDQDAVDFFLFELRRGYADYHASAMAVMLRSLGIPARIAVGYVSGEYEADKERYLVREIHAHAWVEAFFPSYGWIDFNPTPNWPVPPRIYNEDTNIFTEDDIFPADGDPSLEEIPELLEDPALAQGAAQGLDLTQVARTAGMLALLVLAIWLAVRWTWGYGLRGLSVPAQTYEKMVRLATLARFGPQPRETPQEFARALARHAPEVAGHVDHIARGYTRARYGAADLSPVEHQALNHAWAAVRRSLLGRAAQGFWGRLRHR